MMGARIYDYAALSAPLEQPRACRDLVSVQDFSPEEIKSLFELTNVIKHRPADFRAALAGKQLVLFFEKASLRTRLTFEAGMASLGGATFFVDQTHSRMKDRETLRDIAHNVERWVDAVVVRTFEHETVMEISLNALITRPSGVLSAVRAGSGALKLINWRIDGMGNITRAGDSSDQAGAVGLIVLGTSNQPNTPLVTAIQRGDGNLALISWDDNSAHGEI